MGEPERRLSGDKRRFEQLFYELEATAPRNGEAKVHAQTLIAAFKDRGLSGQSPVDRFRAILALTGNAGVFPGGHFGEVLLGIGTKRNNSPRNIGDTGFRQELRDSEHYYFEGDVHPELHRGSSNQIGHFLTAAHIGFYLKNKYGYIDALDRERASIGAETNPLLRAVKQMLYGPTREQLQMEQTARLEQGGLLRVMIGHEMIADGTPKGDMKGGLAASFRDVDNFLHNRLDLIKIVESKDGNSYQDLLLTWVGYRFGEHMAEGHFTCRSEVANWLELMLTDKDLRQVPQQSWFHEDARQMLKLLEQFREVQKSLHPGKRMP